MRVIFVGSLQRAALWVTLAIAAALLGVLLATVLGGDGTWPVLAGRDPYEVRSELLMEATQKTGVGSHEDAAHVWAEGLAMRSAALQYTVMTADLQDEYAGQLTSRGFTNWVTGVSSPWVEQAVIRDVQCADENTYVYYLGFMLMTSTGSAGEYGAALTIIRDGDFWRIAKIAIDPQLEPYTGYKP